MSLGPVISNKQPQRFSRSRLGEVPMTPPVMGFTRLQVLVMRARWADFRIGDVDVLSRTRSTLVDTW
jgi:hypothetical protein